MARPHPALIEVAAGRPLPGLADPEGLIASAFEHKMGGLLWSRVLHGELVLPDRWRDVLFRYDVRNWARHTRLRDVLLATTSRLGAIGVPCATAKGVTAEARWYGRTGERPCFDIDVLIGPDSFDRVGDILAELAPAHPIRASAQDLVSSGRLLSVNLEIAGVPLDLHFDMLKLDLLPSRQRQRLWRRRVPFVLEGRTIDVLDAETSLIQFLLQLNKDSFAYLLGYADVARICARETLDWRFIDDFLAEEGLRSQLYCALRAVTETLGIESHVPAQHGWRPTVWRIVWRGSHRLEGDAGLIRSQRRNWWLPLTARGRGVEAVLAVLRRVLPPPAVLDYYYPQTRGPYLWRLFRGRLAGYRARRRLASNIDTLGPARIRGAGPPRGDDPS